MSPSFLAVLAISGAVLLAVLIVILVRISSMEKQSESTARALREELAQARQESSLLARQGREELTAGIRSFADSLHAQVTAMADLQAKQLGLFSTQLSTWSEAGRQGLEKMRESVESRLRSLQQDNSEKLEKMRETVDEKLQGTLEKRLTQSFSLVNERLEQVYKGLGDMQSLASGVGDLKRVLSNVKARGIMGEIQLENILSEILTNEQYDKNVVTRVGSREPVEFAVRMPGRDDGHGVVWMPIDAKFPVEDYHRLLNAQELGDPAAAEAAGKQMEGRVKSQAKDIKEKYLDPPNTTEFGIMFLPFEGLYAEVIRRPGLFETLQKDYRVVVTGPTTLAAFLNSLQMGFRTLAIQKRSSEVWRLLGAIRTEFGKFGELLERTQAQIQTVGNTIAGAASKSRTIERKLKDVEALPTPDAARLLDDE
ncbi:MAG: DNA recombination protein RmuC [Nitrospirae bacterium]|nr:DNA recombination protein RmuC [Nitrospirota bacterium]